MEAEVGVLAFDCVGFRVGIERGLEPGMALAAALLVLVLDLPMNCESMAASCCARASGRAGEAEEVGLALVLFVSVVAKDGRENVGAGIEVDLDADLVDRSCLRWR